MRTPILVTFGILALVALAQSADRIKPPGGRPQAWVRIGELLTEKPSQPSDIGRSHRDVIRFGSHRTGWFVRIYGRRGHLREACALMGQIAVKRKLSVILPDEVYVKGKPLNIVEG